jgi:hypothetical protein
MLEAALGCRDLGVGVKDLGLGVWVQGSGFRGRSKVCQLRPLSNYRKAGTDRLRHALTASTLTP